MTQIKQIKLEQEETLVDVKSKLTEITIIKEHLKTKIKFKPYFSIDTNSFGHLELNEYLSNDPFQSQILNRKQANDLIRLCEFSQNSKFILIYKGSRDGFDAKDFHSKCDGVPSTLTILQAKESQFIFGGYTEAPWESGRGRYKSDPKAFLFSLTNKDNGPMKMKTNDAATSIYCSLWVGPTFGAGAEICIRDNANMTKENFSKLGPTYSHPLYTSESKEANAFLAGAEQFQLNEIEVYKKL